MQHIRERNPASRYGSMSEFTITTTTNRIIITVETTTFRKSNLYSFVLFYTSIPPSIHIIE